MSKPEPGLPPEVSKRIDEVMNQFASRLREELAGMLELAYVPRNGNAARAVVAAVRILTEAGTTLHRDEIVRRANSRGMRKAATNSKGSGKSDADTEMRRSVGRAASHGKHLIWTDRERLSIGLPGRDTPDPNARRR